MKVGSVFASVEAVLYDVLVTFVMVESMLGVVEGARRGGFTTLRVDCIRDGRSGPLPKGLGGTTGRLEYETGANCFLEDRLLSSS